METIGAGACGSVKRVDSVVVDGRLKACVKVRARVCACMPACTFVGGHDIVDMRMHACAWYGYVQVHFESRCIGSFFVQELFMFRDSSMYALTDGTPVAVAALARAKQEMKNEVCVCVISS